MSTVKIYNKEIKLTSDNLFMNSIKKALEYVGKAFINIKDKINKSTKTNSEYDENSNIKDEGNSSELNESIDDFNENINN